MKVSKIIIKGFKGAAGIAFLCVQDACTMDVSVIPCNQNDAIGALSRHFGNPEDSVGKIVFICCKESGMLTDIVPPAQAPFGWQQSWLEAEAGTFIVDEKGVCRNVPE